MCVVTYSGCFVARWSVQLIIRDFWARWSVLLLIRGIFCAPFVLLTIRVFFGCAGLCCYFFGVFLRTPFVLFIIRVFLGALVCVVNSSGYFCAPFVLLLIRVFGGALVCVVTSSGYLLRAGLFCLSLYKDFQNGSKTKRASRSLLCRFIFFWGRFLIVFWTTFEE